MAAIMEGPNQNTINMWDRQKIEIATNPPQGALVRIEINSSKVRLNLIHRHGDALIVTF